MKNRLHITSCVLTIALISTANAQFSIPPWAGETGAEFSQWKVFTVPFGGPNSPDVVGSTGTASLQQYSPTASITSGDNIYNFSTSSFTVTDVFEKQPEVIVFQAMVSGTQLDVDSVILEFESCGEIFQLAADREELSSVAGGFGSTVVSRWTWNTRQYSARDITIRFAAAGPHCSLAEARLDMLPKPDGAIKVTETATDDAWNYPFNVTPGTRGAAPTFAAPVTEGEGDDEVLVGVARHGNFVFGFDTSVAVESGRGAQAYEIVSASVVLETTSSVTFLYDPTFDSVGTYLNSEHPDFVADTDIGRPMELFGAGFGNGASAATWTETDAYSTIPFGGSANISPVSVDMQGNEVDAHDIRFANPIEVKPFGVGVIDGATPGDPAPSDSQVRFDLDACHPGISAYLRRALDSGRLILTATSLHGNAGQSGGVYPVFYTKDSLIGNGPKLELEVRLYDAEETVMISSIIASSPTTRSVQFPSEERKQYGIRWTEDFKNWFLIENPILANPEAGMSEWVDDDTEAGTRRFYQVYLKP